MRIGEFAAHHNITIDTVRHYIDLGLIFPIKNGRFFYFDELCHQRIQLILQLKRMDFSISQIIQIVNYEDISKLRSRQDISNYRAFFHRQRDVLLERREQIDQTLMKIDNYMKAICDISVDVPKIGVPITAIPLIACPRCNNAISFEIEIIRDNRIFDAKGQCSCGYQLMIEEGIIRQLPSELSEIVVPLSADEEEVNFTGFLTSLHRAYVRQLLQITYWNTRIVGEYLANNKTAVILELGTGIGIQLSYIEAFLDKRNTYLCVDHNLQALKQTKKMIERTHPELNILFFCTEFNAIPLRHGSVDLVIDHLGSILHGFRSDVFLVNELEPLYRQPAYYLGNYLYFDNLNTFEDIEPGLRKKFSLEEVKKSFSISRFKEIDSCISERIIGGEVIDHKFNDFDKRNCKAHFWNYYGKRS